jgi:predicted N-acetyltransferase YhbS
MAIYDLQWRGDFANDELNGLHAEAFGHPVHAFVLDTIVSARVRRQRVGSRLVAVAAAEASAAGCKWLHVDFDHELGPFYFRACGFKPTAAGLLALARRSESAGLTRCI